MNFFDFEWLPVFRKIKHNGKEYVAAPATVSSVVADTRLGMTQDQINTQMAAGGGVINYDQLHPVGMMVASENPTFDPNTAFGGEWVPVEEPPFVTKEELAGYATKQELAAQNTYGAVEAWTGKYWIDGRKIYRKVTEFVGIPDGNANRNVPLGVSNIDMVLSYTLFGADVSGLPRCSPWQEEGRSYLTVVAAATRGANAQMTCRSCTALFATSTMWYVCEYIKTAQ